MSRLVVQIVCPECNRLTGDYVSREPGRWVLYHRSHDGRAMNERGRRQLDRYRKRAGGRSRLPSILLHSLDLAEPWLSPPDQVPCQCQRCGRLTVTVAELRGAVTSWKTSSSGKVVPLVAHRPI